MAFRKKYIGLMAALLSILLLAACGNKENGAEEKNNEPKEITLTDANGKVTIPAEPKRVLAPYLEDSLVALDVTPAAQWSIGETVLEYLQSDLKDVPKIGWDLPLEQTIKAEPDLIVFSSAASIQNGQYEEYKKIAPTYVYKDVDSADWKKQLEVMGKILGKEKLASDKLAQYEDKTKKAAENIKKAIGDETAAMIWIAGGKYYLFENTRFAGNVLYNDLGVSQPEMVKKLPKAEASWQPISMESLSGLDADHLFLVSLPEEQGLAKLEQSNIYKGLPSVKEGNVYKMEDPTHWTINGLIASELSIEQIEKSLTK
ncbi:ABC transporter substrate-binding protein [Peribacillus glennii]|uniref:Ferrichrome ABC transporter substrate-binding protein n=1 Tax=Peribacillus glennii TaxID=2303991 RepID=A0A372LFH7_9BACI|nr:ABC transporter substrate-binding protein [Peribacillus glennii]RFU65040.1 ferrichrome ABC transporter substrate-binding protein [Peribacillus glennii]